MRKNYSRLIKLLEIKILRNLQNPKWSRKELITTGYFKSVQTCILKNPLQLSRDANLVKKKQPSKVSLKVQVAKEEARDFDKFSKKRFARLNESKVGR